MGLGISGSCRKSFLDVNPEGFVKEYDGITPAATYKVKPYPSFPFQIYVILL